VPLLGLEPTTVEKAGENSTMPEDSNHHARLTPLLGTILSQGFRAWDWRKTKTFYQRHRAERAMTRSWPIPPPWPPTRALSPF
ncbi:hypothetical protein, partial [Sphingomonas zeae]